jgi:hypothetical protein
MTEKINSWTVPIIEFEGDLAVEFPDELMEAAGWKVGDVMVWIDNKDGTWTIQRKESNE